MTIFKLYFTDLTPEAQEVLLKSAGFKNETEANWDVFPITTIVFNTDED